MPRYIDAEKFYEALSLCVAEIEIKLDAETDSSKVLKAVQNGLINFPTADVAPVRHAHWMQKPQKWWLFPYQCSACKAFQGGATEYCPDCGAKMDEEVAER